MAKPPLQSDAKVIGNILNQDVRLRRQVPTAEWPPAGSCHYVVLLLVPWLGVLELRGPSIRRLCRPAAATSSARLARDCPRIAARSTPVGGAPSPMGGALTGSRERRPSRYATAMPRLSTPTTVVPSTRASFRGVLVRGDQPPDARGEQPARPRQDPDPPNPAAQRELTDVADVVKGQVPLRPQQSGRDREVERALVPTLLRL